MRNILKNFMLLGAIFVVAVGKDSQGMHYLQSIWPSRARAARNRLVALHVNRNTGELNVLLAAKKDRKGLTSWRDFYGRNLTAELAVSSETNRMINPARQLYPSVTDSRSGDVFQFVEVNFVSASDLYRQGRGSNIEDYIWVPLSALQGHSAIVTTSRGISYPVDGLLLWALRQMMHSVQQGAPAIAQGQQFVGVPTIGNSWRDIPGAILFNKPTDPAFFLTNFAQSPFQLQGKWWPTVEHYFQAQKSADPREQEMIRSSSTPDAARKAGQAVRSLRPDWDSYCFQAMRDALDAKFSQNLDVRQQLLATGNAILVENAGARDKKWGAGPDGRGENHLGRMLMVLRQSISDGINYSYDPRSTLAYAHLQQVGFDPALSLQSVLMQAPQPAFIQSVPFAPAAPVMQQFYQAPMAVSLQHFGSSLGQQQQPQMPLAVSMQPHTSVSLQSSRFSQIQGQHVSYHIYYVPNSDMIVLISYGPNCGYGAHGKPCTCSAGHSHRAWTPADQAEIGRNEVVSIGDLISTIVTGVPMVVIAGRQISLDANFVGALQSPGELERFIDEARKVGMRW